MHLWRKSGILCLGIMLIASVCSARLADWRVAYDGNETPEGVTIGMSAMVLNDVYGPADSVNGNAKHTYYNYYSVEHPSVDMMFIVDEAFA